MYKLNKEMALPDVTDQQEAMAKQNWSNSMKRRKKL